MPSDPLPFWPRYLGRVQAAQYLGVSVDVFDDEVRAGMWPAPRRRGDKGGRLTWDRILLDRVADLAAGIQHLPQQTDALPPGVDPGEDMWMRRINGETPKTGT